MHRWAKEIDLNMAWELALFLLGTVVITAGCLVPARWLPALPNDKLCHFVAYGFLALLAGRVAQNTNELALWLVGLFLAGWLIEWLQNLVPGRRFCWFDMAANTAGILVSGGIYLVIIGIDT